ncbi:MAG: PaaI family thioesterase [Anaerolineaceae bacterium]|nr:PaaI family thioesterase [Anaerolineaceae bacterium]
MKIKQSNTHYCFVCGLDNPRGLALRFESDGAGKTFTRTTFSSDFQGYPGIVHGGILSTVLDEVGGRASMKQMRPEVVLVTGKLTVHFRKPVKVGQPVVIEGEVVKEYGRVVETKATIRSESGDLLVEAEIVLVQPGATLINEIEPADDQWIDPIEE